MTVVPKVDLTDLSVLETRIDARTDDEAPRHHPIELPTLDRDDEDDTLDVEILDDVTDPDVTGHNEIIHLEVRQIGR